MEGGGGVIPNVVGQRTTGSVALPEVAVPEVVIPDVVLGDGAAVELDPVFPEEVVVAVPRWLVVGASLKDAVAVGPACPWKKITSATTANPINVTTAPMVLGRPRRDDGEL